LERLSSASRRRGRGTMQGTRRSSRCGWSLAFADCREYAPGDDTRRFDWAVDSRAGRPFVRQYRGEQELHVSQYVDASASMDFGGGGASGPADGLTSDDNKSDGNQPGRNPTGRNKADRNKLIYAKRLAASVGYMALASYDRVQAAVFDSEVDRQLPPVRG